jgi:NADH-quinone oxidoreductase subunit N
MALVIIAVINSAIAVYYYLSVVRESWFRDPEGRPAIQVDLPTRVLCGTLIGGILALGILPGRVIDSLSSAVAKTTAVQAAVAVTPAAAHLAATMNALPPVSGRGTP